MPRSKLSFRDLLRDFVFGMEDGLVSNLGLVLGVYIGGGSTYHILLAGLASMFAGAFSMAAGSYLSAKSQREVYEHEIQSLRHSVKTNPKRYFSDMKKMLRAERFDDDEIALLMRHFRDHDNHTFVTNYLQKKLGLSEDRLEHPVRNATMMFCSFLAGSIFPIVPFFVAANGPAALSAVILTVIILFAVGVAKSWYTQRHWFKSGLEIVLVGVAAGIIGYFVGLVLNAVG